MQVDLAMLMRISNYTCTALKTANADISTATTTNVDVTIDQAGDLLGFIIEFSKCISGDYLDSIKILDSGSNVKHVIYKSSAAGNRIFTPAGLIYRFAPLQPIFKGCISGDKLRVTFVSTTTMTQKVTVDAEIGQAVQTS